MSKKQTPQIYDIAVDRYIPKKLRDIPLFKNTSELIQHILKSTVESSLGEDYKNKYWDTQLLNSDDIYKLYRELGVDYVADLLADNIISNNSRLYLIPIIHAMKGTRQGLEFVLGKIFKFNYKITEWFEKTPQGTKGTYDINIIIPPDIDWSIFDSTERIQKFLTKYIYAINEIYSFDIEFSLNFNFVMYCEYDLNFISPILDMQDKAYNAKELTNLNATPGVNKITLSWDSYVNATYYEIQYTYTPSDVNTYVPLAKVKTLSYEHLDLQDDVDIYYRVRGYVDQDRIGLWTYTKARPLFSDLALLPTNIRVTEGIFSITLSWDIQSPECYYFIFTSNDGINFTELTYVYDSNSIVINNIQTLTYFRIQTVYKDGNTKSPLSGIVSGTPLYPKIETPTLSLISTDYMLGNILEISQINETDWSIQLYKGSSEDNLKFFKTYNTLIILDYDIDFVDDFYSVKITAPLRQDSDMSNILKVIKQKIKLATPTFLTAIPVENGIRLEWNQVANQDTYKIFSGTSEDNLIEIASVGKEAFETRYYIPGDESSKYFVVTFTLDNIEDDNVRYFQVQAVHSDTSKFENSEMSLIAKGFRLETS